MLPRDHEKNGRHHDSDTLEESQTDDEGSEVHHAAEGPMSDEQLAEVLSKRRIRFGDCQHWVLAVYTGAYACHTTSQ